MQLRCGVCVQSYRSIWNALYGPVDPLKFANKRRPTLLTPFGPPIVVGFNRKIIEFSPTLYTECISAKIFARGMCTVMRIISFIAKIKF